MAAKKKAKGKKVKKKKNKKAPKRKKVATKAAKKAAKKRSRPKPKKQKAASKKRPRARAKPRASAPVATPPAAAPAPGERIGVVTHYFTHLGVAIVQLEGAGLREGDTVHIKGHTSDFSQRVESMEVEHARVVEAHAGQSVGLRVAQHAREHDVVYKVA